MDEWGIKVNEGKTKFLVVGNVKKSGNNLRRKIEKNGILNTDPGNSTTNEEQKSLKYLGILINKKMTSSDAIKHALGRRHWL